MVKERTCCVAVVAGGVVFGSAFTAGRAFRRVRDTWAGLRSGSCTLNWPLIIRASSGCTLTRSNKAPEGIGLVLYSKARARHRTVRRGVLYAQLMQAKEGAFGSMTAPMLEDQSRHERPRALCRCLTYLSFPGSLVSTSSLMALMKFHVDIRSLSKDCVDVLGNILKWIICESLFV